MTQSPDPGESRNTQYAKTVLENEGFLDATASADPLSARIDRIDLHSEHLNPFAPRVDRNRAWLETHLLNAARRLKDKEILGDILLNHVVIHISIWPSDLYEWLRLEFRRQTWELDAKTLSLTYKDEGITSPLASH